MKQCVRCKALKPSAENFCEDCGEKLAESKKCPKCQDVISANQKFCSKCGLNLKGPRIINVTSDSQIFEDNPIAIEDQTSEPKPWYQKIFQ